MVGFGSGGPPSRLERLARLYRQRFSHSPARDGVIYGALVAALVLYGVIGCVGPFIAPPCSKQAPDLPYKNPDYDPDPCLQTRFLRLGGITLRECEFVRNILSSMLMGAIIGYERRAPDRAAGIRSMSLTSLGACCFTICTNFACQTGPMNWDSSRISAAIPSGVGFLGGALIWKGFVKSQDSGDATPEVHGLTTATSVWLSAAVGTACGGNLYSQAVFTVLGIILMLRFGPRNSELVADFEDDSDREEDDLFDNQTSHPAFSSEAQLQASSSFATQMGVEPSAGSNTSRSGQPRGLSSRRLTKQASMKASLSSLT